MATNKNVILITGANSGIGYETAFAVANASPSNHVILAARSAAKGNTALSELQARKPAGILSFLELDITSDDSISRAVESIDAEFGKLDVLINNAGIADSTPLMDSSRPKPTREAIHHVLDTNVCGTFLLTSEMEPLLHKTTAKEARVINVSTGLSSVGMRADHNSPSAGVGYDAYRMSKAAVNMVAMNFRWWWKDWAKVFAICPGFVVSNLTGPDDIETRKKLGAMKPEEAAEYIVGIVEGKRDADSGSLIGNAGPECTYEW